MPVETMYGVSCDECEECLECNGLHAWLSEDDALGAAEGARWSTKDVEGYRQILCPACIPIYQALYADE